MEHPIRYVVERVASGTIGLNVNEIAPQYNGSQTASLGAKLIRKFIAAKASANGQIFERDGPEIDILKSPAAAHHPSARLAPHPSSHLQS